MINSDEIRTDSSKQEPLVKGNRERISSLVSDDQKQKMGEMKDKLKERVNS
jgi:hypothetical protein